MLSCHTDGPLHHTCERAGRGSDPARVHRKARQGECWAKTAPGSRIFPILTKFIDAKGNLSIQVHPSNAYALEHEGQYGKTEMWYVLEAEPDAFLYYGFKHLITKEEYKERIENNTLTEVLNAAPVKKGGT